MSKKRIDKKVEVLIEIYDQAFDKRSWHGTNLYGSVKGLTVDQLLWRPGPKRHNIWELILHAAYWKYAVHRRMTDGEKGQFPRKPSNYPKIPKNPDKANWRQDLALLVEWHGKLRRAMIEFPVSRWNEYPEGSKWNFMGTVYGISSHDLYHAGQIQLLKRLQKK